MVYKIGDTSYEKKIGISRIVAYRVRKPRWGKIEVELEYEDLLKQKENHKLIRQFHYVTNEKIAAMLHAGKQMNLSFSYIKNFNLESIQGYRNRKLYFPSFQGENAFFDGEAKFDMANFGDGKVSFKNAIFGNGDTSFFQTNFGDGEVSFSNVNFQGGSVSFAEAVFGGGNVSFEYAIFAKGNVAFTLARFGAGSLSFDGAIFEKGEVLFSDANFDEGKVSFEYTNFGMGNVVFDRAKFGPGEVLFDHCLFQQGGIKFLETDLSFSRVRFHKILFQHATLDMTGTNAELVSFESCHFQNHDKLNFYYVGNLEIVNCVIHNSMKLSGAKVLSLKDTINLGYLYCEWSEEKLYEAIQNNQDSPKEKRQQFSLLKQNYHKIGAYGAEDKAFVEYMRWRRVDLKSRWRKGLDKLIDVIGAYGTKPGRVAVTMLLCWIFFGIIFTVIGTFGGALTPGISDHWINGMYFSAVTFAAIGYGDVVPLLMAAKILAPIEGVVGLFLMSYFTVSVVRKTLR